MKLEYYQSLIDNESRADKFVQSFVSGRPWEVAVGRMDRINGITKQQMTEFVKRHFRDNYVCVFKRQGIDNSVAKIEKPKITAIPANRDKQSQFLADVTASKAEPIQPVFVDFNKDMKVTKTKQGPPTDSSTSPSSTTLAART